MTEIDIRLDSKVDRVRFDDDDEGPTTGCTLSNYGDKVSIEALYGSYVLINRRAIADLIRALKEAKELWCD